METVLLEKAVAPTTRERKRTAIRIVVMVLVVLVVLVVLLMVDESTASGFRVAADRSASGAVGEICVMHQRQSTLEKE